MFGGNFRKFGTDSYAISGTFCAFALRIAPCAKAVPDQMSPATMPPAMNTRLMCEASEGVEPAIYTTGPIGSSERHGAARRAEDVEHGVELLLQIGARE